MNKTLLLILLDFLLLHMIHDSPWNKVEKENAHLSGGTDTYARHAEELQFVRLQMQAKDKETEMLADQLAFSRKSEADKARDFAQAQAEIKEKEDELNRAGGALSETERQRLIALKDAAERQEIINLKQQDLNTIKDQMTERDKAIITLTNKVERLNTNIGDLKNEIGGLKNDFNTKITNLNNTNAELAKANGSLTKENETLGKNLKTANTQVAFLRDKAEDLLLTRQELQATKLAVKDLSTQNNTLANERDVARKGRTQAETQLSAEKKRSTEAQVEASQQRDRAVMAEKTVVAATTEAKAAKEERDHVLKQNKVLTDDIKEVAKSADFNTKRTLDQVIENAKAIPQSPNKLFNEFIANRVPLQMQLSRDKAGIIYVNGKPQAAPRQIRKTSQPILVQGEKHLYALLHTDQSPFALGPQGNGNWEKADGVFRRNGTKAPVHWLGFLRNDPRIIAVPLHKDHQKKKFLSVQKTYPLAKRPQDYPEAVIIHNGEEYGVVKFKVDPKLPNYVLMDKPFLGGIFSKRMNPSKGDIVVSRTGELLGIMVNGKYCLIIREKELDNMATSFADHVVLKDKTHISNLNSKLKRLRNIIQSKPNALR